LKILLSEKVNNHLASLTYNLIRKTNLNLTTFESMKKIIYILLFALATGLTITSCTDEEVTPSAETSGAGGSASDPGGH
jgi:hypothetical protein